MVHCLFLMFRITNIFSSDTVIDSILHINTTPHEYGHYLCKASNAMGTDQVAFKFHGKYCFCIIINIVFHTYILQIYNIILLT